jgi:hypothetical protein
MNCYYTIDKVHITFLKRNMISSGYRRSGKVIIPLQTW